jgi:hypothetical protein
MNLAAFSQLAGLLIVFLLLLWVAFRPTKVGNQTDISLVLDRLMTVKADVDRLDRVVREDGEQARTGADERGRLLRDEVSKSLTDTRTEIAQGMTGVRGEIVLALNNASRELRES